MLKLGREPGLVRYDSLNGFEGKGRRFWRPRLALYAVAGLVGLVVASFALQSRHTFEANLLRMRGAPFVEVDGGAAIRNAFELHLVNKSSEDRTFVIQGMTDGVDFLISRPRVEVGSLEGVTVPVFATAARSRSRRLERVRLRVAASEGEMREVEAPFLTPSSD